MKATLCVRAAIGRTNCFDIDDDYPLIGLKKAWFDPFVILAGRLQLDLLGYIDSFEPGGSRVISWAVLFFFQARRFQSDLLGSSLLLLRARQFSSDLLVSRIRLESSAPASQIMLD